MEAILAFVREGRVYPTASCVVSAAKVCVPGRNFLYNYLQHIFPFGGYFISSRAALVWQPTLPSSIIMATAARSSSGPGLQRRMLHIRRIDEPAPVPPIYPSQMSARWLDNNNEFMARRREIRIAKWVLNYSVAEVCCHAAFTMLAISYAASDVYALRVLAVLGVGSNMAFQYYRPQPLWLAFNWNVVFLLINVIMISLLLLHVHRAHAMDDEEMEVYNSVFRPVMGKPDFYRLLKVGVWRDLRPGEVLIDAEEEHHNVHLLVEGTATGERMGTAVHRYWPGHFVGEMAFLRDHGSATYTVRAGEHGRVLSWDSRQLRELLEKYPRLGVEMRNLLGRTLIHKLETLQSGGTAEQSYRYLLQGVLVDKEVTPMERQVLREYREMRGISRELHNAILADLGWTAKEYAAGRKKEYSQDAVHHTVP